MKCEGFWRPSLAEDLSNLPFPIAEVTPWKGMDKFLAALTKKEGEATAVQFRGYSNCRICGERNGSVGFALDGWHWPEGFRHYVELHNVRPTQEFIEFVCSDTT